jgi:hypothetical protein
MKSSPIGKAPQKNLSKRQHYLALNRQYTVADYITTVTTYRLSERSLAIEPDRHTLPSERLRQSCILFYTAGTIQTCGHFSFLVSKINSLKTEEKIQYLMEQKNLYAILAAKYVASCHTHRDSQWNDQPEQ